MENSVMMEIMKTMTAALVVEMTAVTESNKGRRFATTVPSTVTASLTVAD